MKWQATALSGHYLLLARRKLPVAHSGYF